MTFAPGRVGRVGLSSCRNGSDSLMSRKWINLSADSDQGPEIKVDVYALIEV